MKKITPRINGPATLVTESSNLKIKSAGNPPPQGKKAKTAIGSHLKQ